MSNSDLDELAAELVEFAPPEKKNGRPASEERVIAGFEEIQRFTEQHGRAPQHGEDRDIFERLYAVRLDRLRAVPDCRALLEPLDRQGLLAGAPTVAASADETIDVDDLAAELADVASADDITVLRHVRTSAEKRAAEEIADRKPCEDFDAFKPLFDQVRSDLSSGLRVTRPFGQYATIEVGHWFILDGQTAYVAQEGEEFDSPQGKKDARLRVIFANGTESNLLRLSLARALYKDETARRITDPDIGPLFSDSLEEGDLDSGTIYVLRSLSDTPYVAEHRDVIHKIGVTGGKVETRIANAEHDSTYLLAKVELVATYKLAGINRTRMENLFHRLFAPARLNITINDRFGRPVQPEEWFLVPLFVIDEAVARIKDGSITGYVYDPKAAKLVKVE
ncbi:GIY-YIG nuclease family protein [Pseudomonas aeruginosa]|uniref:GIY-YIG nuclease family protein n=1 Tax=Pseudomonas aeruginosa TaxID=287 RepID=UPI0021491B84|nr:GIY-YIG nuclease family protein [Pseudomonas aeruginosa]MCQ9768022.1 GIY-YIG nuclease family protein [Pseudomonas aeruginosa]MCQ9784508.1 GIY-YIG nuclease family protein [Pseudomonas aeruginosa]HCF4301587.1 GIY-YIG nuclease family protein [Pseudomonas aeruginosa]